jgi:two-component system sensor histidine kinase BaeS
LKKYKSSHQSRYAKWMKDGSGPPWERGFEHFSTAHIEKRRRMGFRFLGIFLFMGLPILIVGVVLGLVIGGNQELLGSRDLRRLMFCSIPFLVPIVGMLLGTLGMRRWVNPLADVMSAAESLAGGDFGVRVEEKGDRDFIKLARSFNDMAEELEHAQQQRQNLTADVAHELRTPLHILQGNLEAALDGVYEASPEYFRSMLEETKLLQRLVEDLQTLSMAESGTLDYHFQPVNIRELLEDVAASFTPRAEGAGIALLTEEPAGEGELMVEGDWHRLDQVVGNLVGNALRYTPDGGQIRISAKGVEEEVLIMISDSGEGIAEEDLPYIFDRFWKGDKSRSRGGGGVGLGLAISRQLTAAHGGIIEVESQEGKGTTFTVRLPSCSPV